jgi:hypothetical protein
MQQPLQQNFKETQMTFQTFFTGLEVEVEKMLGIAVAAAPLLALNQPNTAATILAVNEAIQVGKPAVDAVLAQAASLNTPLTTAQIAAHAQDLLSAGLSIGVTSGAITAEKAATISAQVSTISNIAAAMAAQPTAK